ncbi:Dyp-type peroxidase [Paracoccus suum]|uniref:Dyp-type peroxidase n=1 Tax=Paracoccus suum TaxID=2259340 RepID=A0A344PN74_9RHOB|nr:Dyp-type peroxidase [Paracoccus suum]AXC50829.1 Dyp-type peroxidase [Paracoccus suum]
MRQANWDRVPIEIQSIDAPLSRAAIFLTLTVEAGDGPLAPVRDLLSGLDDLVKSVSFPHLDAKLSCVVAIGSDLWDRLSPRRRPKALAPFQPVIGNPHRAPATPGDLLFHIRAERQDLCFALETLILDRLRGAVAVADEVFGFRYYDARDLLGFIDGTANPTGDKLPASTLVGNEDRHFAGGSHVTVQKYLHDLGVWNAKSTEAQQAVIGRTKADNIELADAPADAQKSHKTLTTITDPDGTEHDILRDNMPFGRPGAGEFGTYFIGYSRDPAVTQKMLERMFIGDPPGLYDKILDASRAVTGARFFAPTAEMLAGVGSEK